MPAIINNYQVRTRTRDPDLLTLLSYGRLANVYLDVLVDDEMDLPEDASPCGPL